MLPAEISLSCNNCHREQHSKLLFVSLPDIQLLSRDQLLWISEYDGLVLQWISKLCFLLFYRLPVVHVEQRKTKNTNFSFVDHGNRSFLGWELHFVTDLMRKVSLLILTTCLTLLSEQKYVHCVKELIVKQDYYDKWFSVELYDIFYFGSSWSSN